MAELSGNPQGAVKRRLNDVFGSGFVHATAILGIGNGALAISP